MQNQYFDHLGNSYPSISVMCKHYGISIAAYTYRINNGWSKKNALTIPWGRRRHYKYRGHIFTCKEGLLAYAGLTADKFKLIEKEVFII